MIQQKPKAIFFDWEGTLSYSEILGQISDKNHPLHEKQRIIRDFFYLNKKTLTLDLILGDMTMRDYTDEIARRIGIDGHDILLEFAQSFSNMTWGDSLFPKYLAAIREKGIKTVLINNTSQGFRKYTVPSLELDKYFDAILLSCELKCLKYDTSLEDLLFFEGFLKAHRINYDECLILDKEPNENVLDILGIKYEVIKDASTLKAVMKKYI